MKSLFFAILAAGIIAGCSGTDSGEGIIERYAARLKDPRVYVCNHTKGTICMDGCLTEKDWQEARWSEDFVDISTDKVPAKNTRVKMLWDGNYVYIGAKIEEDKIVANLKQRDTIIWKENDFEVFIDPDGDGQSYFEIEINAIGTVMDLMMNRPYRNGGDFYMPWNCPGLIVKTSHDSHFWYAEMAIPHTSLMMGFTHPEELDTWRINFSRVEWIPGQEDEENWVWSPTSLVDMHMPEKWGWLLFNEGTKVPEVYSDPAYKLLWAMFYAQMVEKGTKGKYIQELCDFGITDADRALVGDIRLQAVDDYFKIRVGTKAGDCTLSVDSYGYFSTASSKAK